MDKLIQLRQGDVLLRQMAQSTLLSSTLERVEPDENGRLVLARGETTGHYHSLPYGGAVLYRDSDGSAAVLDVKTDSKLEHLFGLTPTGEHDPVEVPAGLYQVIQQHSISAEDEPEARDFD